MIQIAYTNINGGIIPERELTESELNYTSKKITATHCIYYYGDEPEVEININDLKQQKIDQIDLNTQDLISRGFSFANLTWSLSGNAQLNWLGIKIADESKFPIALLSKEGIGFILPFSERDAFVDAAWNTKNSHLQSGSILELQLNALTTIEEVINFKDNR